MRIYQLFHALIEKFVPMDKSTQDSLQLEAIAFYNKIVDEKIYIDLANADAEKFNSTNHELDGFTKHELTPYKIQHRIIGFLDQWYMRYLNALLFIYLVPKIKAFINGDEDGEEGEEGEGDEDTNDFNQFMEFKRFKKSMI